MNNGGLLVLLFVLRWLPLAHNSKHPRLLSQSWPVGVRRKLRARRNTTTTIWLTRKRGLSVA